MRDWTLADLQGYVTRAEEAGGGWLTYTFHEICATTAPQRDVWH